MKSKKSKSPMKKAVVKSKVKKVDDLSYGDKIQSKAMDLDNKNPKLAMLASKKIKAT